MFPIYVEMTDFVNQIHKFQLVTRNYLYDLKSVDLRFLKGCILYIFSFHML